MPMNWTQTREEGSQLALVQQLLAVATTGQGKISRSGRVEIKGKAEDEDEEMGWARPAAREGMSYLFDLIKKQKDELGCPSLVSLPAGAERLTPQEEKNCL